MALSLALAAGWIYHLPSPVRDVVTEQPASGFHLEWDAGYVALAPWCSLTDQLTVLSLPEIKICLAYLFLAALLIPRSWKAKLTAVVALLGFIAWGLLCPRPMPRLVAEDPSLLLIDFHSHTSYSHDGRKSFFPDKNRQWHRRQGFGAAFITDHNIALGAQEAKERSRQDWRVTGYRSLEGDEASLSRTHLCVFAPHERIDNVPFDSDPARIPLFLAEMHRRGYLVTANLPEYWRFHWQEGRTDYLGWDVDGFEITNSAPRGLDFPQARKRQIVQWCRTRNLFVDGVSDTHGWGSTTSVWNAMRIPGWQAMDPDQLETAVIELLLRERFKAIQVLEREKYFPETANQMWLAPLADLVIWARLLGPVPLVSTLLWLWVLGFLMARPWDRRTRPRAGRQTSWES